MQKITINHLHEMKQSKEKIVALTAYDASFARVLEAAGIELILVGDSLGMVLHGRKNTLGVTIEDMVYHTRQVSAGTQAAMIVTDLPYKSYQFPKQALTNARCLSDQGAAMVKLERGEDHVCKVVEYIVAQGIPVCGHLGLTPQSVTEFRSYVPQEYSVSATKRLQQQALALQRAGASVLVLECVPSQLAKQLTAELSIPVIGIGSGNDCDGQVLVSYDILGLSGYQPKFAKNFWPRPLQFRPQFPLMLLR